jgi:hypothetical protein
LVALFADAARERLVVWTPARGGRQASLVQGRPSLMIALRRGAGFAVQVRTDLFRPDFTLRSSDPSHRIEVRVLFRPSRRGGELYVTLTCPNCGNDRNFLVKTLQMHVVNVEGGRVEVTEESRPAVLEVLCDECESALNFEEFEDTLRKEVLLTIGAR